MHFISSGVSFEYSDRLSTEQIQMLLNTPIIISVVKYQAVAALQEDKGEINYKRIWDNMFFYNAFLPDICIEYNNSEDNGYFIIHVKIPRRKKLFLMFLLGCWLCSLVLVLYLIIQGYSTLSIRLVLTFLFVIFALLVIPPYMNRYYADKAKIQIESVLYNTSNK